MLNRLEAPFTKDAIDFTLTLPPYKKFTLKNGVDVYTINSGTQAVMQLELVFYAGNWFEEKNGTAAAVSALLKNGTRTKTALEINETFDGYGAFCNTACYNETAVIKLSSLTRYSNILLPLVAELITDATFPQQEIDIYVQNALQRLSVSLQKSDFVANRLIDAYLYGEEHPYGAYIQQQDIEQTNKSTLEEFYRLHYTKGACVMFAAGKLPDDFIEQLDEAFGNLPLQHAPVHTPAKIRRPAPEKKYRIINDEQGVQGAIRIATPFITRSHPDFTKVMLLNTVFGGYFGSRLMNNIREEKGYTYGIHSYVQNHIQDSAWMVATDAGKDVSEAAVAEVYKEMEILRNEEIDAEELLLVRNYMAGVILGSLDGPFQVIAKWKNIVLNGLSGNYFDESVHAIKHTSARELQELANKYLQPQNFYELIVY